MLAGVKKPNKPKTSLSCSHTGLLPASHRSRASGTFYPGWESLRADLSPSGGHIGVMWRNFMPADIGPLLQVDGIAPFRSYIHQERPGLGVAPRCPAPGRPSMLATTPASAGWEREAHGEGQRPYQSSPSRSDRSHVPRKLP